MNKIQDITIYHNPRCSKSRQTLDLLKSRGIEPIVIEYLKSPPDKKALIQLLKFLNIPPQELIRKNEAVYQELKLDNHKYNEADLIDTMIKNPILIERPIVVCGNKAAIGRPPEAVLEILP